MIGSNGFVVVIFEAIVVVVEAWYADDDSGNGVVEVENEKDEEL